MKGFKKILTGILAGAMALTMTISAGAEETPANTAAGTGSITISNATPNTEYELYKVFDAVYKTSGDTTNVSYSYDGSNSTFLAALQADNSPFELTKVGNIYVVEKKANVSDDSIVSFIKANGPEAIKDQNENITSWTTGNFGPAVDTKTADDSQTVTFSGLAYGYYFVKSGLGAMVSIDSAIPNATVIDKNQTTTIDKQESVDKDANNELVWKYVGKGTVEEQIPTQAVGAVVNYKLTGQVTQYVGENKVTYLLFTDTMSDGLTPNEDVAVKIANDNVTKTAEITYTGQVTTIKVPTVDAAGEFLYDPNADYEITYTATINKNALDSVQNNTVTLTDNNEDDLGTDTTKVKNYKITLTKIDKKDATKKLAGAKFDLYSTATGGDKIPVVLVSGTGTAESIDNNVYRVAKANETGVEMVTGTTGIIEVKGLKNGSYWFEETEAPEGYNKLIERTEAVVITDADATYTVENSTGLELPSTGGIGTTIFYIIGGLLIVAAVVFFVVRRKADAE